MDSSYLNIIIVWIFKDSFTCILGMMLVWKTELAIRLLRILTDFLLNVGDSVVC